jgi:hypothetical protein
VSHLRRGRRAASAVGRLLPPVVFLVGCSSSSDPPPTRRPGDAGISDGANAQPNVEGDGAPCTHNAHEVVGAKVVLDVVWPSTTANAGGTGQIVIWLMANYDIHDDLTVTGITYTCGNQTPPIPLSRIGSLSEGLPSGQQGTIQIAFDPSVWAAVMDGTGPGKINAPIEGTAELGGWNLGSSLAIHPTNSVFGLPPSSPYYAPTAQWPASASAFAASDLVDGDNDGKPGITATPVSGNGLILPATGVELTAPFAPQADELYVVLRTQLSLYGIGTSCTEIQGTAAVQLLNNHVIGCHLANDGGECSSAQADFIDQNTTVYFGPGVVVPRSVQAASYEPQGITGTFTGKILSTDPDGGGIDCDAVRAALP